MLLDFDKNFLIQEIHFLDEFHPFLLCHCYCLLEKACIGSKMVHMKHIFRGCTGEFPATKSKKLFQAPRTQKKEKERTINERTHHALPPQIANVPSQSIKQKATRGSVLCDDFIAHSQLWRRSGTLAFTARATTLPKLVLNCVHAQKIDPTRNFLHGISF